MNKIIQKYSSKNRFINAFVIFGIAWFFALASSNLWADWEEEIRREEAKQSVYSDYFVNYSILFEKWMVDTQEFAWYEPIVYFSDREIFKDIESFNFQEKIYSDTNGDWEFIDWKIILKADLNNKKEAYKRTRDRRPDLLD